MLFCLIIFLLTLIGENQVVVTGARAGLMLWFHDVLPLLLPFMLLSNLLRPENPHEKNRRRLCDSCLIPARTSMWLSARCKDGFRLHEGGLYQAIHRHDTAPSV